MVLLPGLQGAPLASAGPSGYNTNQLPAIYAQGR